MTVQADVIDFSTQKLDAFKGLSMACKKLDIIFTIGFKSCKNAALLELAKNTKK
ncbi:MULTISPECIES: hypothetical protein [Acinetobacter]|uniref:hypothetical protein n=1 Tax=Acinetobacter TaxID=469 RepID=UPI003215FEF4